MSSQTVSTSASNGATFVSFAADRAGNGSIYNDTGTSLDVRLNPDNAYWTTLASGSRLPFPIVWSCGEIAVRRTDQVATAVTVELVYSLGAEPPSDDVLAAAAADAAAKDEAHDLDPAAHLNVMRRVLTGNLVLTAVDSPQQVIIPDADREVTLPAEGAAQWQSLLKHGGSSFTLTIKRAGGTVVASLIAGAPVLVIWDGTAIQTF